MGNSLVLTRKALAGAATVAILASQLVVAPMASAAEMNFSDVPSNEWYAEYVSALTEKGIIEGYSDGTYKPDNSVNRAEMSKIATKLAVMTGVIEDADDIADAPEFADVPADQWYYGYVSALAKNKVLEGYRDASGELTGRFGPGDFVNRAEASKILLLSAGIPSKLTPATPFVDVNPSDWFYEYVTSAYNWSVIDGYKLADNVTLTGYFGPGDQVTRAQIAKIAVLAQDPVERNSTNSNSNAVNNNSNGTETNSNTNAPMSNVSFEAAYSSATPASKTLAGGTAFNDVLKVDLTAGNVEDVKVTEVTVLHRGISASSVVNGVSVVDRDGMRHGNIVSFSDNKAMIRLTDPIVVAAGTTHTITIQANFNAVTNSGTFKVEIPADGIKAMGAKTNGMVAVKGTFPIAGPEYPLVAGTNIAALSLTDGTNHGNQSLDLGVTNRPIASFKLAETNSNEAVMLTELTVYNNGTAADGDVKNLKLVSQEGTVLATVEETTNRYAVFKLDQPYEITKGSTRTLDIHVDVVNGSSRTVQFLIMNDYDMKVKGETSQAFILPTVTGNFPLGEAINLATISEGDLTLSRSTTSPSGEISNGVDDTVVAEFKVEAFGEDIEIQGGELTLDWGTTNPTITTVRLMNASGATIHSASANDFTDATALAVQNFNSMYTVKAGTSEVLKLVANINETAANGETLVASLGKLRIKKLSSNKFETLTNTAAGNLLTVSKADMIVSKNTSTPDEDIVAGGSQQLIGAFDIKATNTGDVRVNSVKLNVAGHTNISNLKLMAGDMWLGSPVASPTATDNNFSFSGQLTVPKGQTVTLMVYADVTTSASGNIELTLPMNGVNGTAQNVGVSAPAMATALQNYTVATAGAVVVSLTNTVSNSRVVTAGSTNQAIMSFKVKAEDKEAMRLNKVTIEINNESGVASPASVQNVSLVKNGQVIAGPSTLLFTGGDYTVEFTGLNQEIARDAEANYTVVVSLTNSNAFVAGGEISASLTKYEATGLSSGQLDEELNAGVNGAVILTLQKVTPTIANQGADRADVPGTSTTVARFNVTASGTEAMSIDEIVFNVAGSKAAAITNGRLYRVIGDQEVLIVDGSQNDEAAGQLTITPDTAYTLSAGETATFIVKANTSAVKGALDNASLKLSIEADNFAYSYTTNAGTVNAMAPTSTVEFSTITF